MLVVLSGPAADKAWADSRRINLEELNGRLAGQVLDFTQNHGRDRRIWSDALDQRRDLYVYLPPDYSREQVYPLLIWLHGYGGDERQFVKQAVETLDRAVKGGELPPVIAVAPDGSLRGNFRVWGHGSWFTNSARGRFEDFVVDDVPRFVSEHFRVSDDPRQRVAIGWSMGGFAAYKIGLRHPDRFRVLVGVYPNLNMRWCDTGGHYHGDFTPETASWMQRWPGMKVIGVVPGVYFPATFNWALGRVWGKGPEALRRIARENPIDLLEELDVQPGRYDFLIAYGKLDEYNVDAQVDSFLHRARQRGLDVWVRLNPEGHHTAEYVTECLPEVWRELGTRLEANRLAVEDPQAAPRRR